jgi:NAD(P)-dependent dehydrogenase (short-subunit alcohol dehydrogenase family)
MGCLEGKVAIVTGGTSGIGRAIANRYAREGAKVIVGSIDSSKFESEKKKNKNLSIEYIEIDVSIEENICSLIEHATDRYGCLDIMVNNAGISGPGGSVMQLDSDPVIRAFEVLFNGVLYGTKHASTVMIKKGSGNIVNIASITGLVTFINSSHVYSALKSAVIQLTKTTALELGPLGLRVNCICPGFIATPIFGRALNIPEDKLEKSVEIVEELFSTMQPIKRSGRPEDVSNAALWLVSDQADFVTGHALVVDGGASCGTGWDPSNNRFGILAKAMTNL